MSNFININTLPPSSSYTNEVDWGKENVKRLKSLYSGNLQQIFETYQNFSTGYWYRFANDDRIRSIVTPVQSDTVAKMLNTLVEVVYADAKVHGVGKELTTIDLKDLERLLQINGEIVVRWDYIDGRLKSSFYEAGTYDKEYDELGRLTFIVFKTVFKAELNGDVKTFILENRISQISPTMEYILYEKGKEFFHYPLDTFEFLAHLKSAYRAKHRFAFVLKTEYKFSKIVSLVEEIDEALTYTKLSTRLSVPTTYTPEDIAFAPGEDSIGNGEVPAIDILYNRVCGFMKIPTIEDGKQQIDVVQTKVMAEEYQKVIDSATKQVLSIVGLSAITIEDDSISAATSGASLAEREKLTIRTRNAIIQERKEQLENMFIELGYHDFDIDFGTFGSSISPDTMLALNQMIKDDNISKRTALKLLFPHWKDSELAQEERRLVELEQEHIRNAILIAGHANDIPGNGIK